MITLDIDQLFGLLDIIFIGKNIATVSKPTKDYKKYSHIKK